MPPAKRGPQHWMRPQKAPCAHGERALVVYPTLGEACVGRAKCFHVTRGYDCPGPIKYERKK